MANVEAPLAAFLLAACAAPGWQGAPHPQLRAYQDAFASAAGTRFVGTATRGELVALARRSRVLWLGDHHRNGALHRRHLALLEELAAQRVPMALGLEAVGTDDQPALDDFGAGRCDLEQLAGRVRARWPGSWLDSHEVDSDHYRALLGFARAAAVPVFALEPTPRLPLAQRDAAIAAAVRAAAQRWPDRLLVVVVGQDHLLGAGHLPRRTGLAGPALGASPPAPLRAAVPQRPPGAEFVRSDGGLWFYADLLPRR